MLNFKNLVFEGGGVKGIAYGGALRILDEKGILSNIERVAGTSAGAINAALLALGYSSSDVSEIVANTNFASFADHEGFIFDLPRLLRRFGWNKGDQFLSFMRSCVKNKTGKEDFTFGQLSDALRDGHPGFRDLFVISTNLTKQSPEIFSSSHTPDVPIADAVRMSMSIPLYFKAIKWKDQVMVDGGVTYNYPIDIFDNEKYISNPLNGRAETYDPTPGFAFNYETLGFRLDSKDVIEYCRRGWQLPPVKISNLKNYSLGLMDFMMESANRAHLHANDWGRTVFIDSLDVKTTDFGLPEERINALVESGRSSVMKYFEWREKDEEWGKLPLS